MQNFPALYGLNKTNRDFTQKEAWGKNNFNSAFPASLCCYMAEKGIPLVYLKTKADGRAQKSNLLVEDVFQINPLGENTYYAFEAQYSPYQKFVINELPRIDLVVQDLGLNACVAGLEVKLTALPDESTFFLEENLFGSELVVRPDSIVYLACSVANIIGRDWLLHCLSCVRIRDWTDPSEVFDVMTVVLEVVNVISREMYQKQSPFLLQPIWKTQGKSPVLAENCLDIFVWSNSAFCHFISKISSQENYTQRITRSMRSAVWLLKMLSDYAQNGKFDHKKIIDSITFNTKNDKAFSASGKITQPFMACQRLTCPVIEKYEIKNIILGGGHLLLSPERRFDAIVSNTPGLFT